MKKYVVLATCAVILFGTFVILITDKKVTHLDPPLIRADKTTTGESATLLGTGFPEARIAIFINDVYSQDAQISKDGFFQTSLSFKKEGEVRVTARQIYENATSDFSEPVKFQVDLTPPNKDALKITTEFPSFTKDDSLSIAGTLDLEIGNTFLINGQVFTTDTAGSFAIDRPLSEGENTFVFSLRDDAGNSVTSQTNTVLVDRTPPDIKANRSVCEFVVRGLKDYVCIDIGQWSGYLDSMNSVAIVGKVGGDVKSITVDGKKITWDENGEIYQRLSLFINGGLNKYRVVVEDSYGNKATAFLETTASRTEDSLNVNINQ